MSGRIKKCVLGSCAENVKQNAGLRKIWQHCNSRDESKQLIAKATATLLRSSDSSR